MQDPSVISIISTTVSNLGFPIVVTGFLLLRVEKKIETLNSTFIELLEVFKDEVKKKND